MIDGFVMRREMEHRDMAIQAIMYRRAMNEKRITIDKLIGKEQKVISMEEHKKNFEKAVDTMGPDKIPVRKRAK